MKTFKLTINDDGTCSLADEAGAEVGTYQTLDELTTALPEAVGAGPTEPAAEQVEGVPATESGETIATETAEPSIAPNDGEKKYASKKGTRPKTMPGMEDYFKGSPIK